MPLDLDRIVFLEAETNPKIIYQYLMYPRRGVHLNSYLSHGATGSCSNPFMGDKKDKFEQFQLVALSARIGGL